MSGSVIDLSLKIENGMPVYPGDTPVSVEPFHAIAEHGSNTTKLTLGTHCGTHLDAPWHMLADGKKVDEIPLERCIGPATVLDFSEKGPGDWIDLADLRRHERFINAESRILLRTDWGKRFGTESYYEDWPALTKEASRWLASRGIWLLGMETPSVDQRRHHGNHEALLGAEVVLVEGLTNLSALRGMRVFFAALPLLFVARDGSPVRAVAMEEESGLPDLKLLTMEEALQEATPYSATLSMGVPPIKGIPMTRQFFRS